MQEIFDVAIIGMGPGGEVAADRLITAGKKIVVFETELIGGECAYWACVPSKTVLRGPELRAEAGRAAGTLPFALNWQQVRDYRDYMVRHLDDSVQAEGYRQRGARVVRARAGIAGPGRIQADGREYLADHIIVATGTAPVFPSFPGSEQITAWGNREVYTLAELPQSVAIVGGSAVALETATFLAGFGVDVTLLNRSQRLLGREEPEVSALAETYLRDAGVNVRMNRSIASGRADGGRSVLALGDGSELTVDAVVFATGRTPRTEGLGIPRAGGLLDDKGYMQVDEHCWSAEGLWAAGDVTGIMPFTHVAKYQGRIVADCILGKERRAGYGGIPRVVFANPEIASVGLTQVQADLIDLETEAVSVNLPEAIARPWTYEQDPRGDLGILIDRRRQVMIGAWVVAPQASEWIHQAALAIRAQIPLSVLRDQVPQFPSYNEAYLVALDKLEHSG
ncbi:dihydrolipoyl dehydrogenase family protein [Paeniglutamicibacter sp. NPDC091659]|uniref:dihydrolipoyl dehydrogenase family protein n=1 Tax=Paeniglutamicibacter sp. NPDC091659 TaxID=3364389 RepID=UPI0038013254